MPSSRNSAPSTTKPKPAYQPASGVWASSTTSRADPRSDSAERGLDEAVGETTPSRCGGGTTRPIRHARVVEHAGVAEQVVAVADSTCAVPGSVSRPSRSG